MWQQDISMIWATLRERLLNNPGKVARWLVDDGWDRLGRGRHDAGEVVQWAAGPFACLTHWVCLLVG
jgi:hypothetical protein